MSKKLDLANTPVTGRAAALRDALNPTFIDEAISNGRANGGGMNLSAYLEQEDPTADHTNAQDRSLDAFGRVLRACGIIPTSMPEYGMRASTLEDMRNHPQAKNLIGEVISRAYRRVAFATGQERASLLLASDGASNSFLNQPTYSAPRTSLLVPAIPVAELVGQTTGINSNLYKPFYVQDVDQTKVRTRIAEAADIPVVTITNSEKTIDLLKYGRMIKASYESMRRMPLDLLLQTIQRIAIKIEAEKVNKVLDVLINGDGNAGTAATSYDASTLDATATGGTLTLKAWLAFRMKFDNPYMLTHVLGKNDAILKLMLLNTGSTNLPLATASSLYQAQQVVPINQSLADGVRAGWLSGAPTNALVSFDRRIAVERVFEIGGMIRETDRWIENQTEGITMTEVEGYALIEPDANKILMLQ